MTKAKTKKRWQKMAKKSKTWHVFVRTPAFVTLPLVGGISLIYGYLELEDYGSIEALIKIVLIKSVIAYMLGVAVGNKDWDLTEQLATEENVNMKLLKREYRLYYGLLFYGLSTGIAFINPLVDSVFEMVFVMGMWLLIGWFIMGNVLFNSSVENSEKESE